MGDRQHETRADDGPLAKYTGRLGTPRGRIRSNVHAYDKKDHTMKHILLAVGITIVIIIFTLVRLI